MMAVYDPYWYYWTPALFIVWLTCGLMMCASPVIHETIIRATDVTKLGDVMMGIWVPVTLASILASFGSGLGFVGLWAFCWDNFTVAELLLTWLVSGLLTYVGVLIHDTKSVQESHGVTFFELRRRLDDGLMGALRFAGVSIFAIASWCFLVPQYIRFKVFSAPCEY